MLYERDDQACWSKNRVLLVCVDPSSNPQTSLGGRHVCNSADVQAMCLLVHQVQCPVLESEGIYITRVTSKEIGIASFSKREVIV